MNRQEYMETLKKALESFGEEIRDEIVSDYEEHFNMGAAAGKTEEQISAELGSIEELVEELNVLSGRAYEQQAADGSADSQPEKDCFENASEADSDKTAEKAAKPASDSYAETAVNTFTDMLNGFASFLGSMAAGVSKEAMKYSDIAAEKFTKAQEGLEREMGKFSDKYGDKVVSDVKEGASKVVNGVKDGAEKIVSDVREEAGKFKDEFTKRASGQKPSVGEKAGRIAGTIANKTAEAFSGLTDKGSKLGENIGRGAEGVASGIAGGFENLSGKFQEASKKFVDASTAFAKEIAKGYREAVGNEAAKYGTKADPADEDGSDSKTYGTYSFSTSGSFVNEADPDESEDDDNTEDAQFFTFDEKVANVVIDVDCADVVINGTNDNSFGFNYENHGTPNQQLLYRCNLKQENDTVYITVKKQPGMTNFFKSLACPDIELTADIPERINSVTIRSLSGDTSVDDLCAQSLKINTMSGDVNIDNTMCKVLDVNTMSGDISVTDGTAAAAGIISVSGDIGFTGNADELTVKTTSGDVQIENAAEATVIAGSISGDVMIELTGSEGFFANVASTTGDIILECGEESMRFVRSGEYVLGNGNSKVKCTTVSGDINVQA